MSGIKDIFIRNFNYPFLSASVRNIQETELCFKKKKNHLSGMLAIELRTKFHRSEKKYCICQTTK